MPLAEAVVYLRRTVRRHFGTEVTVCFVEPQGEEGPFPVVTIDGKVFTKGTLSYRAIVQELRRLRSE